MGGTFYASLGGVRILTATRVDQSGADDGNVIDWLMASHFILAININSGNKETEPAAYKIRWRESGGTFADLAATGEMKFGATDLVNGDPIAVGGRKCDSQGGDTWQEGYEVEGVANSTSVDLVDEFETELHFSVSPADAQYGVLYEFELWDVTLGETRGTLGATLTVESAPAAVVNQTSFRIRSGDDQSLTSDTGWAAAQSVDANIDMGTRFRIRFELEEALGGTFNTAVKLQYNKNAGGWNDAVAYPDSSPPTTPVIWCRESDTYSDLDPTSTSLLTGSAETHTAGYGNNDPACPAISLSNQSTEHEFVIEIPTWYDGALRNITTDYFDFRLVETDGTPFTGTYDNPRITMTHRAGHVGATGCESPGFMGPVKDGNGNLYWVCEPSESDPLIMMLKSPDGGDEWLEMDGAGRPTETDFESASIVLDNDVIHMVLDNGNDALYYQFNVY